MTRQTTKNNMENKKLENGIEEIKKIKMTALEKKRVFEYIINSKVSSPQESMRSSWFNYSFIARIRKTHLAYYIIVPLIIILASGGMAFASEDSLPDSILYPIKVSIVEPIRGALTFSPKAKAEYESNLATKRMVEAETLAGEGKLNQPTENRLNNLLERHTVSLNRALDKADRMAQTVESTRQRDDIVTNFHANMNAHARVLNILSGKKENTPDGQYKDIQISRTAKDNADLITNFSKNKEIKIENKIQNKLDNYKKRKEAIQSLIDKTTIELDRASTRPSPSNQEIIESTNQTLNKAKQFLSDANEHENKGDQADAYSTLLDSESSAKEAGIFFETGMKFEGKNGGRGND
jgi:hypothetical protein